MNAHPQHDPPVLENFRHLGHAVDTFLVVHRLIHDPEIELRGAGLVDDHGEVLRIAEVELGVEIDLAAILEPVLRRGDPRQRTRGLRHGGVVHRGQRLP